MPEPITRKFGELQEDVQALVTLSGVPFNALIGYQLGKFFNELNVQMKPYNEQKDKLAERVKTLLTTHKLQDEDVISQILRSGAPLNTKIKGVLSVLQLFTVEERKELTVSDKTLSEIKIELEEMNASFNELNDKDISLTLPGLKIRHFKKSNGKITEKTEFHVFEPRNFINLIWLIEDDLSPKQWEFLTATDK